MRLFKKYNITFLLGCMILMASTVFEATGDSIQGTIDTVTEVTPNFFNYSESYWFAQSKSYTEGGVSFSWPDLFTDAPMVIVSVSSNTYSSSGEVTATVVNNTVNGCTVYVNVATLATIGEAATDSFVVHVFAVEPGL